MIRNTDDEAKRQDEHRAHRELGRFHIIDGGRSLNSSSHHTILLLAHTKNPHTNIGVERTDLSQEALEVIAKWFRLFGEVNRLRLLILLELGERSVSELVDATGLNQANVSRHLGVLRDAGILDRRQEGVSVLYSIRDPSVFELCETVCGSIRRNHELRTRLFE